MAERLLRKKWTRSCAAENIDRQGGRLDVGGKEERGVALGFLT